jgi:hypothetical protein
MRVKRLPPFNDPFVVIPAMPESSGAAAPIHFGRNGRMVQQPD